MTRKSQRNSDTTTHTFLDRELSLSRARRRGYSHNDRFAPAPANAVTNVYSFNQPDLDVETLPQTHVMNVVNRRYAPNALPMGINPRATLFDIVRRVHANVGCLSFGIGLPFASGLLIAPNLLLTARHSVAGEPLNQLRLRLHYQKENGILSYGDAFAITGVVEASVELDYAILRLNQPVANFRAPSFDFTKTYQGSSIFIHHPNNKPKQVSVHLSDNAQPQSDRLSYAAFHDSWRGSSGAPYITANEKIFALHILYQNAIGATWMQDIYNNSTVLRTFYNGDGTYQSTQHNFTTFASLPILTYSHFNLAEVQIKKPIHNPLPPLPTISIPLSRHHIIPQGHMEFLYLRGEEYPSIKTELLKLVFANNHYEIEGDREVAWARWNWFVGPATELRGDDPGENLEPVKPQGFNETIWAAIRRLYAAIESTRNIFITLGATNEAKNIAANTLKTELQNLNNISPNIRTYQYFTNRAEWETNTAGKWILSRATPPPPAPTPAIAPPSIPTPQPVRPPSYAAAVRGR